MSALPQYIASNTSDEELLAILRQHLPASIYQHIEERFDSLNPSMYDALIGAWNSVERAIAGLSEGDEPIPMPNVDAMTISEIREDFKDWQERCQEARSKLIEAKAELDKVLE